MKYVAIIVFGLHVLAETVFGLRGYLNGAFSWQAGVDVGALAPQVAGSARFLASGLLTLAALGAAALIIGVGSQFGRVAAILLAGFHTIGAGGVLLTSATYPEILSTANGQGAFGVHAILGFGFLVVALLHRRIAPALDASLR